MNRSQFASAMRQRGVVLIFALLVLLIMAIGAVAILRSVNSSLLSSGNLAFHRDLVNQAEQAVSSVMTEFKTTGLPLGGGPTTTNTTASLPAANYSATTLPSNAQGVPLALLDNAAFALVATPGLAPAGNDIAGRTSDVTIRYIIDRLCTATPPTVIATSTTCVQSTGLPTGGTANRNTAVAPPSATVYRISVRVDGPRNTQAFLQTTFTKPD
jgi:type IV pilus assembly protein PilX